ncbi:MAG TPA: alpha/beta fold hydrolase [Candidatus Binataceae bacterium]|nr:alpha/beta fold hydrolase [Candidatus Binataceae bacterium]
MAATSERTVTLWENKVNARVKVAGQGPPLVFLHSGYGLIWSDFLDQLARDFTVYAPEHPGTSEGDPDSIKGLDDFWDLVLFYYELFDKLGLDAPALVGHSFGGMVAAELAATNPKRVDKLVLIDSLGLWRDDTPIKNYMVAPQADLDPLFFHDTNHPARKLVFMNPEEPDSIIRVTWALGCTGKFIWPIPDKGLRKRAHRIAAPTLLIWGKEDGLTKSIYADDFKQLIPGARIEMVAGAGHMAPFEQPAAIAALVRDFIKK